ncbi:MAG: TonB-dependent receptor [Hyphomonadaceae bacterium]
MSTKKTQSGQRKSLLAGASVLAAAAAAIAATPAMAQDNDEDTIIVTGSRIPQPNLQTTSPVTQVTAEDITTQGVTRIEDMTNQLPQVFAAQGSNVSNGASGTAQVSLRGLGANRTLVLLNGRRMAPGSPNSPAADLNSIPGAMVERVELLTGGASAVYGSDAISGVVNFIMRDDFEGFRVDGQYGFFQHNNDSDNGYIREVIAARGATNPSQYSLPDDNVEDGYGKELTFIFGASTEDGRGNVTAYLGYRTNDAILQGERDYSSCAIANPSTAAVAGVPTGAVHWNCGGSATSYPGYFYFAGTANTIDFTTGSFIPFAATNQYNFGPSNYYQRPDERYSGGAFARYEINEHAEAYGEFMFTDYSSRAQIAPSGDFFSTNTINCDNPLLTASMAADICGADAGTPTVASLYIARRNVEGGPRFDDLNYTSYRLVAGVRGAISDTWSYDVSGVYSRVLLARTYNSDLSVTRLNRALNVVDVGGVPTCQSVVDGTDPNCVPWDIFHEGGVTQAALNYLQIPLIQRGNTFQQTVTASIQGPMPITSPGAQSPLQTVFGLEYRRAGLGSDVDANFRSGDGSGQGGPTIPTTGAIDSMEFFTEARMPLIEGGAFAELLSIDAAYRYAEYNNGDSSDTYKVGLEWAPTSDIRFRGSFQHAVRAPNVIELFGPAGGGLFNLGFDPCDSTHQPAGFSVPAQCFGANTWQVTTAQSDGGGLNNPAGQYNGVFGGNANLSPEEADTVTLGLVFTPSFVPGLNISLDHFDIQVDNVIGGAPQAILANCYYANDLDACALIVRNAAGRIRNNAQGVTAINSNVGSLETRGWDINADYRMDIGSLGSLGFQLIMTKVDELVTDLGGGTAFPAYDCVGKWAGDAVCGTPTPEWRHRFRVSWETPWDLELDLTWRHSSETQRETVVPFPGTLVDPNAAVANQLGTFMDAVDYFDLAGNYQLFENTNVRFGINNLLDQDPPISTNGHVGAGFGNGNTFPQVYDANGRWIFVGATVDF